MDAADAQRLFDLALSHQRSNEHEQAASIYRQILIDHPANADAWNNLGIALKMTGDLDGAAEAFRRSISLLPHRAETYAFLGHALRDAGRLDEAIATYRQGLAIAPDARTADSLLLALHAHPGYGRAELLAEHRAWNRQFAEPLAATEFRHPTVRPTRDRPKVGYVAADLGNHPLGRFLLPLLENHDHAKFEIFCYNDHARPDSVSTRLRAAVDQWLSTANLSHKQLAQQIHADGIDILVDLTMHAPGSRLLAFARKPAPVQVTYLAYASTTGLTAIDFRLTDPYLDPVGVDESLYSERSLRLPYTYWCYPPPPEAPQVANPPALKNGYLTFGCLNSFSKINVEMMGLWTEILHKVPHSRLILHAQPGSHRDRTKALFAQNGIDPERIEFAGFLPLDEYFAAYNTIDVALDTYPWAGGATTCDALWMGVPVVTLAGETAVSRGGLSILSNLGLTQFAARRPEQYVQIATSISIDSLAELRSSLRGRMLPSKLMDGRRFASDVEEAFRTMWISSRSV